MQRNTAHFFFPGVTASLLCGAVWALGATAAVAAPPPPPAAKPAAAAPTSNIAGIDTSSLTPSEADSLRRLMEKFPSACGKPHSLLKSLQIDPKCTLSGIAARFLHKLLTDGFLESEAEERYTARFMNNKVYEIDTSGAAVRGDPKAPITIVEFSDFECQHCLGAEPWIKQILNENPDVKLMFMNYPITHAHPNAEPAAAASIAAGKQGKFWAYHDKLFENQDKLRLPDLLKYATDLGLNIEKFKADMTAAKARVDADRKIGEKVGITGTPSFFVNGRSVGIGSPDAVRSYIEQARAVAKP